MAFNRVVYGFVGKTANVVGYVGDDMQNEIDAVGTNLDDAPPGIGQPEGEPKGLWIWEGHISWPMFAEPDEEPTCKGEWRQATVADLIELELIHN